MERCESWLNRHAWRACVPQKGTVGSNPTLSARGLGDGMYAGGSGTSAVGRVALLDRLLDRNKTVALRHIEDEVVLGGEVAVPCHPQSAIAGLNPS
jgi:hypothetical protein